LLREEPEQLGEKRRLGGQLAIRRYQRPEGDKEVLRLPSKIQ
jgi:hypothetical protein